MSKPREETGGETWKEKEEYAKLELNDRVDQALPGRPKFSTRAQNHATLTPEDRPLTHPAYGPDADHSKINYPVRVTSDAWHHTTSAIRGAREMLLWANQQRRVLQF